MKIEDCRLKIAEVKTENPTSGSAADSALRSHSTVRPLRPGELAELIRVASTDDHTVRGATHVVVKDGHIIGCLSFTHHVALCQVWLSTQDASAVDSLEALAAGKAIAAEHGNGALLCPCRPDSPFHDRLVKFGFTPFGNMQFHVQSL